MSAEQWRGVPGFEGLYEASDEQFGLNPSTVCAITKNKAWTHV